MCAQAAIKPNILLHNGAYGHVCREAKTHMGVFIVKGEKKATVMLYQIRHGNRSRSRKWKGLHRGLLVDSATGE